MWSRVAALGIAIYIAGTIAVRLFGHHLLKPGRTGLTVALYLISFVAMALLVLLICRRLGLPRDSWPKVATILILPTLLLDPFSCLFFTNVFPNLEPAAAGLFGGWMLMCCGGGVAGTWVRW